VTAFDHEKLDVYQTALEFIALVSEMLEQFPSGRHALATQLDRAATSVVLNIAEGAGEFSRAEKARFYRMAKRSATECAAALDVCRVWKAAAPKHLDVGRELLLRVVAMLIRMILAVEADTKPKN
jgi:four helix bundle protein